MRGKVLLTDVRLELDDAPDPGASATGAVGADKPGAQKGACRIEGGSREELPIDDRNRAGRCGGQPPPTYAERRSLGMSGPRIVMNAGISVVRKMSAVVDWS